MYGFVVFFYLLNFILVLGSHMKLSTTGINKYCDGLWSNLIVFHYPLEAHLILVYTSALFLQTSDTLFILHLMLLHKNAEVQTRSIWIIYFWSVLLLTFSIFVCFLIHNYYTYLCWDIFDPNFDLSPK